jgi:exonuclease 3'-5' domain-containing protein 1
MTRTIADIAFQDFAPMDTVFVDTQGGIIELIDCIAKLPAGDSILYISLDYDKVSSEESSIAIMTILPAQSNATFLIGISNLRESTFTIVGKNGQTLKSILESTTIAKVFFGVQDDANTLYAHYAICLRGVEDVYLMENAYLAMIDPDNRKPPVVSLGKCIQNDLGKSKARRFYKVLDKALKFFDPELGGSYQIFNVRPLPKDITLWCSYAVSFLPELRQKYWTMLTVEWKKKVEAETQARVVTSQSGDYRPFSEGEKIFGPWHGLLGDQLSEKEWMSLVDFEMEG